MEWLRRLFKVDPRQADGEGEGAVDVHDLPCCSGAATSQGQWVDNTSQISGTSVERPPYIPECEVFTAGGPEANERLETCDRNCKKDFIPVKEFTIYHLPEWYRDEARWKGFRQLCLWTVKLEVRYTSVSRPDTHPNNTAPYPYAKFKGPRFEGVKRTGTGLIIPYSEPSRVKNTECPCPLCKKCQKLGKAKKEYFSVIVLTAAHVVYDDLEAGKTVCELFDDDPTRKKYVKVLYGVKGADIERLRGDGWLGMHVSRMYGDNDMGNIEKRSGLDMFAMECVSHDMRLYELLKYLLKESIYFPVDIPVIVSHPHGSTKMVGIGEYRGLRIQLPQTHAYDTPYTLPVNAGVDTEMDLMTLYPEFFMKDPVVDTIYQTTQPLHVYIPCDTSNIATFRGKERFVNGYFLPEGSRCCSVDERTDIPADVFRFIDIELFRIFNHNDFSHHYVYDIHTCNGSSGAWVPTMTALLKPCVCHFGKMPNDHSLNRTGDYTSWRQDNKNDDDYW